jgi:hypothetical protein
MAPLTLQLAGVVVFASLLYVVLFVGKRGRNLPPGMGLSLFVRNVFALTSKKALQRCRLLAICTSSQPRSSFSSEFQINPETS